MRQIFFSFEGGGVLVTEQRTDVDGGQEDPHSAKRICSIFYQIQFTQNLISHIYNNNLYR